MGISFKLSKTGKRFHPKTLPSDAASFPVEEQEPDETVIAAPKKKSDTIPFSARKLVVLIVFRFLEKFCFQFMQIALRNYKVRFVSQA